MQVFGISEIIEKIHAVFKFHDSRLKKLENSRYTAQLESRLSTAFERIYLLEQKLEMQSPKIFDDLLIKEDSHDTLFDKVSRYFNQLQDWRFKISDNRHVLIEHINRHKQRTQNTIYGYLITWSNDKTTVGYVGESCDKSEGPTKRPEIMLGVSKSLSSHNVSGESVLLWDIMNQTKLIKKITYFVGCNLGKHIEKETKETKEMENKLYEILGGQNRCRVSIEGDIISVENWIEWLTDQSSMDRSVGYRYAQKIHHNGSLGREHCFNIEKSDGLYWKKFARECGFFI